MWQTNGTEYFAAVGNNCMWAACAHSQQSAGCVEAKCFVSLADDLWLKCEKFSDKNPPIISCEKEEG